MQRFIPGSKELLGQYRDDNVSNIGTTTHKDIGTMSKFGNIGTILGPDIGTMLAVDIVSISQSATVPILGRHFHQYRDSYA